MRAQSQRLGRNESAQSAVGVHGEHTDDQTGNTYGCSESVIIESTTYCKLPGVMDFTVFDDVTALW